VPPPQGAGLHADGDPRLKLVTDHEIPLGNRTRAYLERQRTGAEASEGHGLTPPAERRARKRYLKSFEHPIPDLFDTKDGKEK